MPIFVELLLPAKWTPLLCSVENNIFFLFSTCHPPQYDFTSGGKELAITGYGFPLMRSRQTIRSILECQLGVLLPLIIRSRFIVHGSVIFLSRGCKHSDCFFTLDNSHSSFTPSRMMSLEGKLLRFRISIENLNQENISSILFLTPTKYPLNFF